MNPPDSKNEDICFSYNAYDEIKEYAKFLYGENCKLTISQLNHVIDVIEYNIFNGYFGDTAEWINQAHGSKGKLRFISELCKERFKSLTYKFNRINDSQNEDGTFYNYNAFDEVKEYIKHLYGERNKTSFMQLNQVIDVIEYNISNEYYTDDAKWIHENPELEYKSRSIYELCIELENPDDELFGEIDHPLRRERHLFLQLFLSDLEFARQYLSVYYPFTNEELEKYFVYLDKGDAHYSVFMNDIDKIFIPKLGLCFNKNIEWTDVLKNKWRFGIWNPFIGAYFGTGIGLVEIDEIDRIDILPLDISRGNEELFDDIIDLYASYGYSSEEMNEIYDDNEYLRSPKTFDHILNFQEFSELFEEDKWKAVINENLWQSTLRHIIDKRFMTEIMSRVMIDINKLYDKFGYDKDGYDIKGYDKDGYNSFGFDAYGYNKNGYDRFGYDEDGYNKDGHHSSEDSHKSVEGDDLAALLDGEDDEVPL